MAARMLWWWATAARVTSVSSSIMLMLSRAPAARSGPVSRSSAVVQPACRIVICWPEFSAAYDRVWRPNRSPPARRGTTAGGAPVRSAAVAGPARSAAAGIMMGLSVAAWAVVAWSVVALLVRAGVVAGAFGAAGGAGA